MEDKSSLPAFALIGLLVVAANVVVIAFFWLASWAHGLFDRAKEEPVCVGPEC